MSISSVGQKQKQITQKTTQFQTQRKQTIYENGRLRCTRTAKKETINTIDYQCSCCINISSFLRLIVHLYAISMWFFFLSLSFRSPFLLHVNNTHTHVKYQSVFIHPTFIHLIFFFALFFSFSFLFLLVFFFIHILH